MRGLFYKYFSGKTNKEEERRIMDYVESSDAVWREYLCERKLWDAYNLHGDVGANALTHFAACQVGNRYISTISIFWNSNLCTTNFRFIFGLYFRRRYIASTFGVGSLHRCEMMTWSYRFCETVVTAFCVLMMRIISFHCALFFSGIS